MSLLGLEKLEAKRGPQGRPPMFSPEEAAEILEARSRGVTLVDVYRALPENHRPSTAHSFYRMVATWSKPLPKEIIDLGDDNDYAQGFSPEDPA